MRLMKPKHSNGSSHHVSSRAHVPPPPASIAHSDEPRRMSGEIEDRQKEVERLHEKIKSLNDELSRMGRERDDVINQLSHANRQVEILQNQSKQHNLAMDEVNKKFADMRELLRMRTNELTGVQKFLTREDKFSGKDAIEKVQGLNNEILQTAAYIADSIAIERSGNVKPGTFELGKAFEGTSAMLGKEMAELLKSTRPRDDPLLLEILIQSCLAGLCEWFVRMWDITNAQRHRILAKIYEGIRDTEEQAVAGRWRALTISQMRRTGNNVDEFVTALVYRLLYILVNTGWAGNIEQVRATIMAKFRDRLVVIAKQAIRLRKTIGEDIISSNYELFYVEQGTKFDPAIMDDAYAEKPSNSKLSRSIPQPSSGGFLCSELGLRRTTKESKENGRKESIILKPKVVFYSELKAVASRNSKSK